MIQGTLLFLIQAPLISDIDINPRTIFNHLQFSVFHAGSARFSMPDSVLLIIAGFSVGNAIDWFLPHDIYLDPGSAKIIKINGF